MKSLALLALVTLGLALAGCGGSATKHSLVVPVSRQTWHKIKLVGVGARFISPTRLAFLTSGSSSCPPVPYKLIVESPDSIRIDLTIGSWRRTGLVAQPPPKGYGCTADFHGSQVAIAIDPSQINVHHPLKVSLYYPLTKKPVVFTAPPI